MSALTGWTVILLELAVAVSMLASPRGRRVGLGLAALLHLMIIALMGLFSFGLAMIGAVAVASGGGTVELPQTVPQSPPHNAATDRDGVPDGCRHQAVHAR